VVKKDADYVIPVASVNCKILQMTSRASEQPRLDIFLVNFKSSLYSLLKHFTVKLSTSSLI